MVTRVPDDVPYAAFVELDSRCVELLAAFYDWLKSEGGAGMTPEEASPLAFEADRYLRDFLVEFKELPPEGSAPSLVGQYLGNWYIIHTLEPSTKEIDLIAQALSLLHHFFAARKTIPADVAQAAIERLKSLELFHARLESFWELTPETIVSWRGQDDYRAETTEEGSLQ